MELSSLEQLENQVVELLERYKHAKAVREELAQRVNELETEIEELKKINEQLRLDLDDARSSSRDKEDLVRAKVDELLTKIEGT